MLTIASRPRNRVPVAKRQFVGQIVVVAPNKLFPNDKSKYMVRLENSNTFSPLGSFSIQGKTVGSTIESNFGCGRVIKGTFFPGGATKSGQDKVTFSGYDFKDRKGNIRNEGTFTFNAQGVFLR